MIADEESRKAIQDLINATYDAMSTPGSDVAALFGIDIAETASADIPTARKQPRQFKTVIGSKSAETKIPPAKKDKSPRTSRSKPEPKWVSPVRARKLRATAGSQD